MSDDGGTTVEYFYPDCTSANTWYFMRKDLTSPDNSNGADLSKTDTVLYNNNNSSSTLYLNFLCIAESVFEFDNPSGNSRTAVVGSPVRLSYPQDTLEIGSVDGGGAIAHLAHDTKKIKIKCLLRDTSSWTNITNLIKLKNYNIPYLLETDMYIIPVVIKSIDYSDVAHSTTVNDTHNYYYANIEFEEYLGD